MRLARMFSSFLDLGPSCKTRSRRTWNTCADRPQDQVRERRKSRSRDQLRLCFEHIGGSQALCNHLRLQENVNKMQIHTVINGFLYSNKVGSRSFFKGMSKMLLNWISEAKRIQFYFKKNVSPLKLTVLLWVQRVIILLALFSIILLLRER